jgi:hypothetical protein
MVDRNLLALHDRIDEEHFEVHLLKQAVRSLQERVILLESEVRELRREAFERQDSEPVRPDTPAPVRAVRSRST